MLELGAMNSISPKVTGYLAPLVSRSKIIVQPLARASSAMNVSKLRGALPQSWFKNKYEVKNLSIAVAEIKTADGGVERIMSVSGNAWHGVNAPKSTITWQGKTYNIVKVDPKNLPTNVNNANHAEKRLFEYINSNYSNKAINVKIAVENPPMSR